MTQLKDEAQMTVSRGRNLFHLTTMLMFLHIFVLV